MIEPKHLLLRDKGVGNSARLAVGSIEIDIEQRSTCSTQSLATHLLIATPRNLSRDDLATLVQHDADLDLTSRLATISGDNQVAFIADRIFKLIAYSNATLIVGVATLLLARLIVALLTKEFNVIATIIPLLCFRPILTVSEYLKRRVGR